MLVEQKRRSVVKTNFWRIWATLTTIALIFFFLGELKIALLIGFIEVILKMILYIFHERFWNKMKFGKNEIKPSVIWFTGLFDSSKSTLSENLYKLLEKKDLKVELLDGE